MGVLFSWQTDNWAIGMGGGLVAGALFATLMSWFASRQTKRFSVAQPDFVGEPVIFEGPANHFKGAEGVGGYLWLTARQLLFQSHKLNIQNHECRMPISEIAEVEATRTLGIIPNGLLLRSASGTEERFVVHKNRDWVAQISGARVSKGEPAAPRNPKGEQGVDLNT